LLFFQSLKCSSLVRVWVRTLTVRLSPFVPFWQMFGDGKTFLVAEQ